MNISSVVGSPALVGFTAGDAARELTTWRDRDVVAAAMIDRLVHHADVVLLKGDSYRLRNRDLGRILNVGEEPA